MNDKALSIPNQNWKRNLAVCWFGCFSTNAGACLVMPFLSFFIQDLGLKDLSQVEQLSGVAFSVTFLAGCLMSPFWGKLADRRGRKTVLMYTGLGLTLSNFILTFTPNVQMLIVFRLLQGLVSGYNPAATSLVAKDTPTEKAGWALATLSTGQMAGTLVGPIIGGYLNELMPIRMVYLVTSGFLFISFLASFFLQENRAENSPESSLPPQKSGPVWQYIDMKLFVFSLLISTCLINTANQSIEPIVSLFVQSLLRTAHTAASHVSFYSGIVVSATGFGILLTAPLIGKIADKTNYIRVLQVSMCCSAAVFIPMIFVSTAWQLMGLRFLLGIAQAGILPIISTLLKRHTPGEISGRIFGYNQAAQYLGLVLGPMLGAEVSSYLGFRPIFVVTSFILIINLAVITFIPKSSGHTNDLSNM